MNKQAIKEGAGNRKAILAYLKAHPGCTQAECARALKLSPMAVNRHVRLIRESWGGAQTTRTRRKPAAKRKARK